MLRITTSRNAAGAAKYFDEGLRRADYFAAHEQTIGQWGGKAAMRLGLSGEVNKQDFVALCHNYQPDGNRLNPRHSENRKVGYDFTFSVPKSVSVAYAIGGDERICQAFEQSVEETMTELESDMRTQTGQGKDKQHRVTGEMIWASFTHRTSRPVDGIPDPHLHRHCFAINTTWNAEADRFQAGEFGSIKQAAPYYEAAFDARLAVKMRELGYQVERRGYSWEIAGIEDATLSKFSRRTERIEQAAAAERQENGAISAKQKEQLGALTRAKKLVGQSWEKLRQIWRSWLSAEESDQLAQAADRGVAGQKKNAVTVGLAVQRAGEHLFERKSVVREYQLKAEALKRGYGDILPEQVQHAVQSKAFYRREIRGRSYITTEKAVDEEYRMLSQVRKGIGRYAPINPDYQPQADYLNDEQRAAIHHALNDRNQVILIAGGAGTGKTTLMKEVRDGIETSGTKLYGFAPSAAASRGVMREEGFDKADTLAQLLHNPKLQEQTKNGVIWVDEAGLIGNKDMNRLLEIARQQKARLLLTGDIRQHSSVAAGDALRILEQEGGIPVARIHHIQRQKQQLHYKKAVSLAAKGKIDAALWKLDEMGNVTEIADGKKRLNQLVNDYVGCRASGKSALIVSPTHMEGRNVTQELRAELQKQELVGLTEHNFLQLKNTNWTKEIKSDPYHYRHQDLVVEYHQNAAGHVKGERWRIAVDSTTPEPSRIKAQNTKGEQTQIDLAEADRLTVYRPDHIALAKGDTIRLTKGGKTLQDTRLNNGDMFTVTGFTRKGDIKLHTGKTLSKDFGHFTYGYVTTSHSSQGRTVQEVFIAQSSDSLLASNRQQFYVSISRGKERCRLYTDDKKALEQAVKQDGKRMTAREIAAIDRKHRWRKMQEKPPVALPQSKHHGRNHAL